MWCSKWTRRYSGWISWQSLCSQANLNCTIWCKKMYSRITTTKWIKWNGKPWWAGWRGDQNTVNSSMFGDQDSSSRSSGAKKPQSKYNGMGSVVWIKVVLGLQPMRIWIMASAVCTCRTTANWDVVYKISINASDLLNLLSRPKHSWTTRNPSHHRGQVTRRAKPMR